MLNFGPKYCSRSVRSSICGVRDNATFTAVIYQSLDFVTDLFRHGLGGIRDCVDEVSVGCRLGTPRGRMSS
ncbi:MAG: hypothetical protein AAGA26_10775, partial [Pseudomonadota bacterium]